MTKVADPTVGTAGQALTYTLTVTNAGPFPATGVIATDAVPAGAVFVAASASQGTASLVDGAVVAQPRRPGGGGLGDGHDRRHPVGGRLADEHRRRHGQ